MTGIDTERAIADYVTYVEWGGRHSYLSWLDRYKDDYRTDEGSPDE